MASTLNNFKIFSRVNRKLKQQIKLFHVFDNPDGHNVLFITSDDMVYVLGSNQWGVCGLGHNTNVDLPEVLPELCHKNIKHFFNGRSFVLALNCDNQLYGWGNNSSGQLGIGIVNNLNECIKPVVIESLEKFQFNEVSCGITHSLLLTTNGMIVGWGDNEWGQIGCGKQMSDAISTPIRLKKLGKLQIKSVYCGYSCSFVLTNDGLVYSWGRNEHFCLGHDLEDKELIFEPKLIIDVFDIISICTSGEGTYFLNNEGLIYYCGIYQQNGWLLDQKKPEIRIRETNIKSLHSILINQEDYISAVADAGQLIYSLRSGEIFKTEYKTIFDFYSSEYELTKKAIEFNENVFEVNVFRKYAIFEMFSNVIENLKHNINSIYVFDETKGSNALFITNDDLVYGFGSNFKGCCGFGHDQLVESPKIIPELCNKKIKQFFNCFRFVLALNDDNEIYGWGTNDFGQLGIGTINANRCMRPTLNEFFKNKTIKDISCGNTHSLVLTSDGKLYGWGLNSLGQIGCRKQSTNVISISIQLKLSKKIKIKKVYCNYFHSLLLTNDGLVYSWGFNNYYQLGHELDENSCIFEPKLINISNVISICLSMSNTYFLTNEGLIYFCGKYRDNNNEESFQKLPKLIKTENKFNSLHCIPYYFKNNSIASAVTQQSVYSLKANKISQTKYQTIIDFYSNECQLTTETINLFDKNLNFKYEEIEEIDENISTEKFEIMCKLGEGGYGSVYKVRDASDQTIYAIKRIKFESSDKNLDAIQKEVEVLSKCNPDFVVKYYNSWFEMNCFCIQMELCSDNLKNIIQLKSKCFKETAEQIHSKFVTSFINQNSENKSMNLIEFFISSQLFKEVLECVQYLHEFKPNPIIHRDLKPANILINQTPRNGRFVKLCDFGLATFDDMNQTQYHTGNRGTIKYMAPEVKCDSNVSKEVKCEEKVHYTTKADVYSLGQILCDLFNFDINLSDQRITRNKQLTEKSDFLEKLAEKMQNIKYSWRPDCSQILSEFNSWGVKEITETNKKSELKYINQMKEFSNKFFDYYFEEKVKTTERRTKET